MPISARVPVVCSDVPQTVRFRFRLSPGGSRFTAAILAFDDGRFILREEERDDCLAREMPGQIVIDGRDIFRGSVDCRGLWIAVPEESGGFNVKYI